MALASTKRSASGFDNSANSTSMGRPSGPSLASGGATSGSHRNGQLVLEKSRQPRKARAAAGQQNLFHRRLVLGGKAGQGLAQIAQQRLQGLAHDGCRRRPRRCVAAGRRLLATKPSCALPCSACSQVQVPFEARIRPLVIASPPPWSVRANTASSPTTKHRLVRRWPMSTITRQPRGPSPR